MILFLLGGHVARSRGNDMHKTTFGLAAGAALLCLSIATAAQAAPVTYTQVITNAQGGRLAGAAIPVGATVTLRANAETTAITAGTVYGAPGSCVLTTSPTVQVNAGPQVAITQPIYACARSDGSFAGFWTANNPTTDTQWLTVAYTATAFSLSAPSVINYAANTLHSHNEYVGYPAGTGAVTVTGGDYAINSEVSNTAGSSLTTAAAAPPATIPTLSEWAMILMGLLLAGAALVTIQRKRLTA